jgi:hypothetical protein
MQALLGSGYVVGQAGRRFTLFKLIVLVAAVALTTGFWVLVLALVSYVAGVHSSTSWLVGAGVVIAVLSGAGLAFVTGLEGQTPLSASPEAPPRNGSANLRNLSDNVVPFHTVASECPDLGAADLLDSWSALSPQSRAGR